MSSCISCGPGTYNPNTGSISSSKCLSCPANSFSSTNSSSCLSCPSSLPIAPPGSSQCSASNLCALPGEGNVGIIPLVLTIPFAFIGAAIYYVRSRTSSVETLSLMSMSLGFAITGLDLISDAIFIIFLLSGSFIIVTSKVRLAGAIFISVRFLHPVIFTVTTGSLFGMILLATTTRWKIFNPTTTTRCNITALVYQDTYWLRRPYRYPSLEGI